MPHPDPHQPLPRAVTVCCCSPIATPFPRELPLADQEPPGHYTPKGWPAANDGTVTKARPLASRWNGSVGPFTLQSPHGVRLKSDLSHKQLCLASSPALSYFPHSLTGFHPLGSPTTHHLQKSPNLQCCL